MYEGDRLGRESTIGSLLVFNHSGNGGSMSKRVTEAEKDRMRELRVDGMSYQAIAAVIGRSNEAVACVCDPERKAKAKAYQQSPEHKAIRKAYKQTPEYKAYQKAYDQTPGRKAVRKAYNQTPERKAILKAYHKAYNQTPEHKAVRKTYQQTVQGKLRFCLRSRLRKAINGNYKAGSAVRDLGCSIEQLKAYLENKFHPDMTWDNWAFDGWHIDHIKPLASFDLTDREQFLEACHYTNLQPLWAGENMSKGASLTWEAE